MPRVFTVYNCGTNFNRERTEEVIANLASRTLGAENRDWMINDGVGSKPSSKDSLAQTPGLRDPVTGFRKGAGPLTALRGTLQGYGWDQNVEHAVAVIKALLAGSSDPPTTINMAGWSRGAITCHMLAHALFREPTTRHLRLNIFAFDPVPGPGNFRREQTSLPGNVARYAAVFMEDEARKIMKPVIIDHGDDEESATKFSSVPLPGAHETAVFSTRTEVGTIAAGLAHKFLSKHGTRLRDPLLLTDLQYCELYAKVRLDIHKYRRLKGNLAHRLLLGSQSRGVRNDFRDTAYFVNAHHAGKFGKTFGALWAMFESGCRSQAAVAREAQFVCARAPTTYQSLVHIGIL